MKGRVLGMILGSVLLCVCTAWGLDTSTRIMAPTFRTLKVSNGDDFMGLPVIRLNSEDRVVISFDEIGDEVRYLRYRLLHCNADWQPSQLLESEYLNGFNEGKVEDYGYSSNTFVHYVNYRIVIPNDEMMPLLSGNYLLQVYEEFKEDEVVLQARFSVSENVVNINGYASANTDRGNMGECQQVRFEVGMEREKIMDPFSDLRVTVEQNGNPLSRRELTHPLRVDGNVAVYDHLGELIFPSGNEYRRFETTQVAYPGMHTDSIRFMGKTYHAWLGRDIVRAKKGYEYDVTQRGRYMVRELNSTDSDLGADYVVTHFTLALPWQEDVDIYLDGEFTGHLREKRYKLEYDTEDGLYWIALPLKQGSYNYRYVAVKKGDGEERDENRIEGNKYETVNEYDVRVYYRPPGARGDRLLGTGLIVNK